MLIRPGYITTTGEVILPPLAGFIATPQQGQAPLSVIFANTTTGEVTSYQWDFGDGVTSTLRSPSHIYNNPGVYPVTLIATSPGGSDTLTREAYVEVFPMNQPPVVVITSPDEGEVVSNGSVQVSGTVSDDGTVAGVRVNDVEATLSGDTFSAIISLEGGNQIIDVVAEDSLGAFGFVGRVVRVDGEGPMVGIQTPPDRQAVYSLSPQANVSYTDFYASVDTATFSALLTDDTGAVTDVSGSFSVGAASASGALPILADDTVYTLTVSMADVYGNVDTDNSNTFYVPPDPESISPPSYEDRPGWVSGIVYDSSTCNDHLTTCRGLAGVQVTLARIDHETREIIYDLEGAVVSGPDGFYAFPVEETGTYALRLEKDGYTYGQREVAAVRERSTAVNAIYLTPFDPAVTPCNSNGCRHVSADGMMQVDIPPEAIPAGDIIEVTATNFDQVEFLPSGLPPDTWETYAFNLGGDSEVRFLRPITVSLQNYRGFDPGAKIPLGYWNQNTLQWEHVGIGVVDESGDWLNMVVDHFSMYDCNLYQTAPILRRCHQPYPAR